ncbi:MAG: hypothetical protein COA91_00865 [Robiginitomaculum sp.]|nr:MAG: hypothetical protein COA91_00865 [Robiginitomaculum sp.]
MTKLLNFLARTPVLWTMFILFLILGVGFHFAQQAVGGPLLDMQMNAKQALVRLGEMSAAQKHIHLVATLTLDTLYPLAYGGLLAGLVWRFGGKFRNFLVIPASLAVITDFAENTVQAFALAGSESMLAAKDILTPLKYTSLILAAIITLVLLLIAVVKRLQTTKT